MSDPSSHQMRGRIETGADAVKHAFSWRQPRHALGDLTGSGLAPGRAATQRSGGLACREGHRERTPPSPHRNRRPLRAGRPEPPRPCERAGCRTEGRHEHRHPPCSRRRSRHLINGIRRGARGGAGGNSGPKRWRCRAPVQATVVARRGRAPGGWHRFDRCPTVDGSSGNGRGLSADPLPLAGRRTRGDSAVRRSKLQRVGTAGVPLPASPCDTGPDRQDPIGHRSGRRRRDQLLGAMNATPVRFARRSPGSSA